jgi:hypothetical protein
MSRDDEKRDGSDQNPIKETCPMSVAYTFAGEPIALPPNVVAFRTNRMKPKGAPEPLYDRDGIPLTVPVDFEVTELRELIGDQFDGGEPFRIRFDPIDERGKIVDEVPAGYILFTPTRAPRAAELPAAGDSMAAVVLEAMRMNAAMAQTAVSKLPAIMEAAAKLLAAADGAGMPARPALPPPDARNAAPDDDGESEPTSTRPRNATAEIIEAVSGMMESAKPYADIAFSFFGGRGTPRNANAAAGKAGPAPAPAPKTCAGSKADAAPPEAPPPLEGAALLVHIRAVMELLTDDERRIAQTAAGDMSQEDRDQWIASLGALSPEQAAAEVKRLVAAGRTEDAP